MLFSFVASIEECVHETAEVLELVHRVRQGDHEAFRHLINLYAPRLQRLLYHRVSSVEDVNDAQQEIFIRFFKSLHNYQGKASVFSFLYRIAERVCADMHHTAKRHAAVFDDISIDDIDEKHDDGDNTISTVLRRERLALIRQLIGQIRDPFRDVFILSELEGYSDIEIAQALGVSGGTVKSRLSRARAIFRKLVFDHKELFVD